MLALSSCIASTSVDSSAPSAPDSTAPPKVSSSSNSSTQSNQLPSPNAAIAQAEEGSELWSLLRQGTGYTVMLRHAFAPGTGDPANFRLGDCATQRNLSEVGRQQAVQIGETFRQYQIPVDAVFSSQWCRCLETARLMNLGEVEPLPAINSFFQDRMTEPEQTAQVRQLILDRRNTLGVTILVTHQVNITAITGIVPGSGGMVVLRAQGDEVALIGEISPVQ
jgi:phosphohistidine phosphatase SixA